MIAFIDGHRADHGVEPICEPRPIAPSTCHAPAARRAGRRAGPGKRPARARSDAAPMAEVRRASEASFGVRGARKVWRQLAREGIVAARCTVGRLMRTMGPQGIVRGRKIRTAGPDPAAARPLDRVDRRRFQAPRPNALRASDLTCVARPGPALSTSPW